MLGFGDDDDPEPAAKPDESDATTDVAATLAAVSTLALGALNDDAAFTAAVDDVLVSTKGLH